MKRNIGEKEHERRECGEQSDEVKWKVVGVR